MSGTKTDHLKTLRNGDVFVLPEKYLALYIGGVESGQLQYTK